jgi:hypothetical protein
MNAVNSNKSVTENVNANLPKRFEDLSVGDAVEISMNGGDWQAVSVKRIVEESYSLKAGVAPIECPNGYLVLEGVVGVVDRITGEAQCARTYRVRLMKSAFGFGRGYRA